MRPSSPGPRSVSASGTSRSRTAQTVALQGSATIQPNSGDESPARRSERDPSSLLKEGYAASAARAEPVSSALGMKPRAPQWSKCGG